MRAYGILRAISKRFFIVSQVSFRGIGGRRAHGFNISRKKKPRSLKQRVLLHLGALGHGSQQYGLRGNEILSAVNCVQSIKLQAKRSLIYAIAPLEHRDLELHIAGIYHIYICVCICIWNPRLLYQSKRFTIPAKLANLLRWICRDS